MKTIHRLTAIVLILSMLNLSFGQTLFNHPPLKPIPPKPLPTQPQVSLAVCAMGMVVIVVGTVVIVKMVNLCKQVLPPTTNTYSPTNNDGGVQFIAPAGTTYAAAQPVDTNVLAAWFTIGKDTSTNLSSSVAVVMSSGITISTNGMIPWLMPPQQEASTVSASTLMSQIQTEYGLAPGQYTAIGAAAFTINRQPVPSIPGISWDWNGGRGLTITNGNLPTYTAVYERLSDFNQGWQPFLTNTISAGMTVKIEDDDASANQCFYRIILQNN